MIERRQAIRWRVVALLVNEGKPLARGAVTRYRYGGRQAVLIPLQSEVRVPKERKRLAVWACRRTLGSRVC
jgi:hypothetical protein